ncbi:MAG: hypothetical protein HYX53_04060 [Chloroflexi bacterium]|nr:hypothetical protein [Chloroflexota bacterium]
MTTLLPFLRLLQVSDSGFPVGGFAYSHGLEWLARQERLDERALAALLRAYVRQVGGGQWLPAARAAHRAGWGEALIRIDDLLDASIAAPAEREAGRAMGERLLVAAADLGEGATGGGERHLEAVRRGDSPGQYAVVFGALCSDHNVPLPLALGALGMALVTSVTQAAVRLGLVGQGAATRLVANASQGVEQTVVAVLERPGRFSPGAFAPALDVAALLHPTVAFRMFAS